MPTTMDPLPVRRRSTTQGADGRIQHSLALPLPVSGRQQELGELSARTGHLTSSPEREFRVQPKRREPGLQVFEGIERRTLNA